MATSFCAEHSGTCQALETMQKLQEDLRKPDGTVERIYSKINRCVSWAVFSLIIVICSGIVGTTFVELHATIKETQAMVRQVQIDQASMKTQLERIDKVINHRGPTGG